MGIFDSKEGGKYQAFQDWKARWESIKKAVVAGFDKRFPIAVKGISLDIRNVKILDKDFSKEEQKQYLMSHKNMTVPVVGDLILRDEESNKVLDTKTNFRLMNLPKYTERFTFIDGGNEYSVMNQHRVKAGVYTRFNAIGNVESQFNTGGGRGFKINMDPESGVFHMTVEAANINLLSFLKQMGMDPKQIVAVWGKEIYDANLAKEDPQALKKVWMKFFGRFREWVDPQAAITDLNDYFKGKSTLDPKVTMSTLGTAISNVSLDAILMATGKMLRVNRQEEDPDDRDSMKYKKLYSVDNFFEENIREDAGGIAKKLIFKLYLKKNLESVPPGYFTKYVKDFVTQSELSSPAAQTNILEVLESPTTTTIMGKHGIGSTTAVPDEARNVHPSHMGVIDPIRTPESIKVGVTSRSGIRTYRGPDNDMYVEVRDVKTGKTKIISASEMSDSVIAFPGEMAKPGNTAAVIDEKNKQVTVPKSRVQYEVIDGASMFGMNSNLVPIFNTSSPNRLQMASKASPQALPLMEREAALVMNQSSFGPKSFDDDIGGYIAPRAPEDGTVVSVTGSLIKFKGKSGTVHNIDLYENFPFNQKTMLHNTPVVKAGMTLKKGDLLADSNYTKDGTLSLGKNLSVGYMNYNGLSFEDGIVISESASKKLTSEHVYSEIIELVDGIEVNRNKFIATFPMKVTAENLAKIDESGVAKKGAKIAPGEIIIMALQKRAPTASDIALGKLSKGLLNMSTDASIAWTHDHEGEVLEVYVGPKHVKLVIKTHEPVRQGDKLCYDEATEVLTESGWVGVKELTLSHKVANLVDGTHFEYQNPVELHKYPTGGRMYKLETQLLDFMVTENHNQYVRKRYSDSYGPCKAKDILGKRVSYKKDGVWVGEELVEVTLPVMKVKAGQSGNGSRFLPEVKVPTKTYMMLLGCFLSDGNLVWDESSGSYGMDITQIKPGSTAGLLAGLRAVGVKFEKHSNGTKYRIYSKQLAQEFKALGKAKDKHIPLWVFGLKKEYLKELFKWLMWGDGHTTDKGRPVAYTTISKRLADDVQRLALHVGYAASIKERAPDPDYLIKGKYRSTNTAYYVRILTKKVTPTVNHSHVKDQSAQTECIVESFKGAVYCCTMPNSNVIYVRRNGKAAWSCNSGRWGNKGVVSAIIPDDKMPRTKEGPLDMFISPEGLVSRMNPGQIFETALGKIAKKTGKPYILKPYGQENVHEFAKAEAKKHGVETEDEVYDPETGRSLGKIFNGQQYILKLSKTTESAVSGRGGEGTYTINKQPAKGGFEGAKTHSVWDTWALLGHNAKGLLRETSTYKGERNDEFWRAIREGKSIPKEKTPFVMTKFIGLGHQAGVDMVKDGDSIKMFPMTDARVMELSAGEVSKPLMVKAKDLSPEKDGLFDYTTFGGLNGNRYGHIDLKEKLPNPIFEEPIRVLLNLTKQGFDDILSGRRTLNGESGVAALEKELGKIKVKQEITNLERDVQFARGQARDKLVKKLKYLRGLERMNKTTADYFISKVAVIPPEFRPVVPSPTGSLLIAGANTLYRDVIQSRDAYHSLKGDVSDEDVGEYRKTMYESIKALQGMGDPVSPDAVTRNVKGAIREIAGDQPKHGFFQGKVLRKPQDVAGRGVAVPMPSLKMDQLGLPETIAYQVYRNFIIQKLVQSGVKMADSEKLIDKRDNQAKNALLQAMKERPVTVNRAPILHKFNHMAFWPVLVPGSSIGFPSVVVGGFNLDYDGDQVNVHVPSTPAGLADAMRMFPSKNLNALNQQGGINYVPSLGAIVGLQQATKNIGKAPEMKFKTKLEADQAFKEGKIDYGTPIQITKISSEDSNLTYDALVDICIEGDLE